jgi:peptidoglycan/xylan/chitin deacetylase (PgdA/CDA1 family)
MSTKSNNNAVAAGRARPYFGDGTLASDVRFLQRARMELAYFSGYARLKQRAFGGAGVVLRFERVRAPQSRRFQPLQSGEITPQFLDRMIRALKRWKYDIVTMDEVCRRSVTLPTANRFVALTFDGGYKDVMTAGYPVLAKHGVPFTIYLPTAFPDGLGEAWWLALDEMVAREQRISLVIDRKERHFAAKSTPEKYEAYEFLASWMRTLPPADLSFAIKDLCKRYSVDLAGLSRGMSMDWDDLTKLATDPNVTFGSATVNYPVLSSLKDADAQREIAMGKAVAEAAFHRDVKHFAYPFGDREAFRRQHVAMAQEIGLASAVTVQPAVVESKGYSNLHALPRVAWDGRQPLRMMRVLLSGMYFAQVRPKQTNWS